MTILILIFVLSGVLVVGVALNNSEDDLDRFFPPKTVGDIITALLCLPSLIIGIPMVIVFSGTGWLISKVWNFRIFK